MTGSTRTSRYPPRRPRNHEKHMLTKYLGKISPKGILGATKHGKTNTKIPFRNRGEEKIPEGCGNGGAADPTHFFFRAREATFFTYFTDP